MKHPLAASILIALSLAAAAAWIRPHAQASSATPEEAARTPVVVELFTSEGCSSCPPADELLAHLSEQQNLKNAEVIALEEHVDYWNNLGWADPFSSWDWTARQYNYAGVLGNVNAYTPQMVVDGQAEFVGSSTWKARHAIQEAAGRAKTPVTLTAARADGTNRVNVSANVGKLAGTTPGNTAEVWLAITETGLHSAVTRGENAGEDLHHAAVVRSMRKIGEAKAEGETSFTGDATVPLQKEWKRENLRTVVFVQEKKSRRILGAAEIRIAP
jgi:hypothetical protein